MPGVSNNNPLIRAINQAAAERGNVGRGTPPIVAPLKTLLQTQATSPNVPPGVNNGQTNTENGVASPTDPGVGAQDDGTTAGIQAEIANQNGAAAVSGQVSILKGNFKPRDNILDQFASYTYRASVYLMSPEQYRALALSKKKNVNGYMLLFQSGGAPSNTTGFMGGLNQGNQSYAAGVAAGAGEDPATQAALQAGTVTIPGASQKDAGRNPAFPNDFYIDSITLESLAPGPGTRAAHGTKNIKFTVVEPANITLIDCIDKAVQDFIPNSGKKVNYNSASYLMVLRWYGYDANGKLIPGITGASPDSLPSDPNAVIEKFIPFRITKLNWGVSGKLVTYDFEGRAFGLDIGAGTRRGTIPYDLEINSNTIGKLLGGDLTYSSTSSSAASPGAATTSAPTQASVRAVDNAIAATGRPAPPKADAAPGRQTIASGLMAAMNQFQEDLVKQQKYEVADTYKITFVKGPDGAPSIENATLVPPGTKVEKGLTAMTPQPTANASGLLPEKSSVNNRSKNQAIVAGQQIVQAIDLAIRNSSYILDQALTIEVDNETQLNPKKIGSTVYWYNITMNALPKLPYDNLRNDFAFDIEFVVSPYVLQDFSSKYFPLTKFLGVHKSYEYWFTGKNSSVLDYQESLNNTYNITVSGTNPKDNQVEKQRRALQSSMREQPFYTAMSASTESRQGSDGKDYEPSANAAEYFYDPKGVANCKLKILGDPAWIQQGSVAGGADPISFSYGPFLPDGTINYDASQVMFEIAWQRPEDYDLATGLADPYARANTAKRQPIQSRVYTAKQITSEFRQGRFEQILEGRLYNFPKPTASNNKSINQAPVNAGFGDGVSEFGDDPRLPDAGLGASNGANLLAAPSNQVATTTGGESSAPPLPATPNTGAIPENPPKPTTSNGGVTGVSSFAPPSKIGQADVRAIDNAIAAGENTAAFGRFRPPRPSNPQVLARDDR